MPDTLVTIIILYSVINLKLKILVVIVFKHGSHRTLSGNKAGQVQGCSRKKNYGGL